MLQTELNQEYRDNQLANIRQKNNRLDRLVSGEYQVQTLAAIRSGPKAEFRNITQAATRHMSIYNTIQYQAKLLHTVLQQKLEASARCCQVNCDFLKASQT